MRRKKRHTGIYTQGVYADGAVYRTNRLSYNPTPRWYIQKVKRVGLMRQLLGPYSSKSRNQIVRATFAKRLKYSSRR